MLGWTRSPSASQLRSFRRCWTGGEEYFRNNPWKEIIPMSEEVHFEALLSWSPAR
jgi:hypothetical protein